MARTWSAAPAAGLADWQADFAGLTFGRGTDVEFSRLVGWLDSPPVRSSDQPMPAGDGLYAGVDYSDGRTVEMDIDAAGAGFTAAVADLRELVRSGGEWPLTVRVPPLGSLYCMARLRRRSLPVGAAFDLSYATGGLQWVASDPRLYAVGEPALSAGLAAPAGGLAVPTAVPFALPGSTGGSLSVTNTGTTDALPVLRLDGPCTNPKVTHRTSGAVLPLTITLTSGDYVELDLAAMTVTLNGLAGRLSALAAAHSWFAIAPGANDLGFEAAAYDAGARLTVNPPYSAWL